VVNKRDDMSTVGGCCQQLKKYLEFAHRSSSLESTHVNSILFLDSILTFGIRAMSNHSCTPPLTHRVRSSSPVPWKPRYSGREVIIERVVEKATMAIVYLVLTRTNYVKSSLVMRGNLQEARLWDVLNKGDGDYHEDKNALVALL
jgi:hypothetical protein